MTEQLAKEELKIHVKIKELTKATVNSNDMAH